MQQFTVVYDVTRAGVGLGNEDLLFLLGIPIGVLFIWLGIKKRQPFVIVFSAIWLLAFTGLGLFGFGNVYYQQYRCEQWTRSGDYQIVEGPVMGLVHHFDRPIYEQFSVEDVTFKYSPYDLSLCGFNGQSDVDNLIRNGLLVRIAYRDGRILKLEIANNQSSK
jgi:hypothetical protein